MDAPDRLSVSDQQPDSDGTRDITYLNRRLTAILMSDAVGFRADSGQFAA